MIAIVISAMLVSQSGVFTGLCQSLCPWLSQAATSSLKVSLNVFPVYLCPFVFPVLSLIVVIVLVVVSLSCLLSLFMHHVSLHLAICLNQVIIKSFSTKFISVCVSINLIKHNSCFNEQTIFYYRCRQVNGDLL